MATQPELTLYTNHACPFAQRAHIALKELQLPFNEVIIDLKVPRTKEYLAINPRGTVPTLKFNEEIIPESSIVAQFLAEAFPSNLVPADNGPQTALQNARINVFIDSFTSKVQSKVFKAVYTDDENVVKESIDEAIRNLVDWVEPLLADANPFFGGSKSLTLAEVQTGPFVVRTFSWSKNGFLPADLSERIQSKAPNFYKWAEALTGHESISSTFHESLVIEGTERVKEKFRSKA